MKLAWKALLALGSLLVFIAFSMDTTVSAGYGERVHNLGLQARQQMVLILGGILFLAGIGLYGVSQLKRTKEDEEEEALQSNEERANAAARDEAVTRQAQAVLKASGEPPQASKQVSLKGDISDLWRS